SLGGPVICGYIRLLLVRSRFRLVHRNRLAAECPADTLPRAAGGRLLQTACPAHLPVLAVHTVFPNPGAAADIRSKQKSTAARSHEAAVLWSCVSFSDEWLPARACPVQGESPTPVFGPHHTAEGQTVWQSGRSHPRAPHRQNSGSGHPKHTGSDDGHYGTDTVPCRFAR